MYLRKTAILAALAIVAALLAFPAAGAGKKLAPDVNVQREIESVVQAIVRVSRGADPQDVLDRIPTLESAARNSRPTLLLQIALYLRDAKGTERSMGAAMLLDYLDFSAREVEEALAPYLDTDDPKLRRVFEELLAKHAEVRPGQSAPAHQRDQGYNEAKTP